MTSCKISVFEHNKGIFHLGQCPSCYSDRVLAESPVEAAEEDKLNDHVYSIVYDGFSGLMRQYPNREFGHIIAYISEQILKHYHLIKKP